MFVIGLLIAAYWALWMIAVLIVVGTNAHEMLMVRRERNLEKAAQAAAEGR